MQKTGARRTARPEAAAAMRQAALAFLFLTLLAVSPARAELASIRNKGIDYVSLDDAASHLGLRLERLVPPSVVMLKEGARPVARMVDRSRDADIKGLRVFFGDPIIEHSGGFYISRADYESRLLPRLRPELCGPPPRQPHIIAIDPGHGGPDDGTENRTFHTMEKTYTLDVALRLRKLLEAAGFTVVMTRDKDFDVPKQTRSEIANVAGADILVSIHFNSLYPNTRTTGVEILSFPPRTQRSTNSFSPGQGDDSQSASAPINDFNAWNMVLAGTLHRRVLDALHSSDRGEKLEHLGVLRQLKCPGVLVESAFLSSDAEAARLAVPTYRDTIAQAMLAGIQDYAEVIRRLRPAVVPLPTQLPAQAQTKNPSQAQAPAAHTLPTRPAAGP
jgi:N-acetylmuramoyl-L-alanine amidase